MLDHEPFRAIPAAWPHGSQTMVGVGPWTLRGMMELTQIVGFVAGAATTFAALPDLIAMLKQRSSNDMNPRMAAILGTFQNLWVIYGVLIGSRKWNVIAVVTNYLAVGAFIYFRRGQRRS
jgi:MtN3 and saliva related transmembrane protein